MFVPIVRKLVTNSPIFIERSLPKTGKLLIKQGDVVEPFTKLGTTQISYKSLKLGKTVKVQSNDLIDDTFYKGSIIGQIGKNDVVAPFDGKIIKAENGDYVFEEKSHEYTLLSGIWGEVSSVMNNKSVLIKSQTLDMPLVACTNQNVSGELIVFPNPSDILQVQYLEKFAKNLAGNIVYIGDFAKFEIIRHAIKLGVGGLISGGADKTGFNYAHDNNIFLGVFSGFGKAPTPNFVFDRIKEFSNRFVFAYGEISVLRVPMPKSNSEKIEDPFEVLCDVVPGLKVQLLEKPYFGWIGTVDSVGESSIFVKLEDNGTIIQVNVPNFLAIK